MSWWQGVLVVLLGNLITLVPMVLSGHPGTKYGVPFPVLARASFGVRGASLPAMLRSAWRHRLFMPRNPVRESQVYGNL